jgi:uncharacterized protein (TIGR03066 family)
VEAKGKQFKAEGAYKVEGDKLTITNKTRGKEETTVSTITKLTEDDLVFDTPKSKKTDKLKRVR